MSDKISAKNKLCELVDKFQMFISTAVKSDISEETVRTWVNEFLLIFGWDVKDTNQILQERTLGKTEKARLAEINSTHSRPDYILLNGKNIKTFIDTKDLNTNLFEDTATAFQLRSYGWSANTPCTFATNFQQLVIYDCRFTPDSEQPAHIGATQLEISDYVDNFDMLYDYLNRKNVISNRLEEIYKHRAIEGSESLDSNFNHLLSEFRIKLANALIKCNTELNNDVSLLNYYTQVILDRIVFIRVCESRGIEKVETLKLFKNEGFWESFKQSCYTEFYEHYDGAMFERDKIFQSIKLGDELFSDFIESLYYPFPYKFDVIPVKVIAQIYEDFLSKQLRIVNGKVIEELKSEYIKANGAISTPQYIIDAVCRETLNLNSANSVEEIMTLNILDPACGSGGFLISCFELISQRLINLYKDSKCSSEYDEYYFVDNSIHLTVTARREIIKKCLYGIDIDETAIEVTKMSLALKVIDDSDLLILNELGVFGNKILAEIDRNILLGNTLVSTDIDVSENNIKTVKPLNIFASRFSHVYKESGGFDFIVGNPPYVETKHYKLASPELHKYIQEKYSSFEGKADLSIIFIERCLSLLNNNGRLGFIVQKRFFKTAYGKEIREIIASGNHLDKIIDIKTEKLFPRRMTYVAIMILCKKGCSELAYEMLPFEPLEIKTHFENNEITIGENAFSATIPSFEISSETWAFESYKLIELLSKLKNKFGTFEKYNGLDIKDGIQALWKKAYHITDYVVENNKYIVGVNGFNKQVKLELAITRPTIYNKLFYCFMELKPNAYSLFPYANTDNNTSITISEIKNQYPLAYKYLMSMKEAIQSEVEHYDDEERWHLFTRKHNHGTFSDKKIIIPMTAKDTIATCSLDTGLYMDNANVWFVTIIGADDSLMKAISVIINSTVFSVLAKAKANPQSGGYFKFNKQFLRIIPFPSKNIYKNNVVIKKLSVLHDKIKNQQTLYLKSSPNNKKIIEGVLADLWREVDNISDTLYELTEQQISLIHNEGRTVDRINLLGGL